MTSTKGLVNGPLEQIGSIGGVSVVFCVQTYAEILNGPVNDQRNHVGAGKTHHRMELIPGDSRELNESAIQNEYAITTHLSTRATKSFSDSGDSKTGPQTLRTKVLMPETCRLASKIGLPSHNNKA